MKVLYYDCFAGISGDMNLGALIDLGVDKKHLVFELEKLHVKDFQLSINRKIKKGIEGTKVDVIIEKKKHHEHRHLKNIEEIILNSALNENIKSLSMKMFTIIAKAEAKIHGKTIDEIHFHEVGAIDSIIDIVGAAICVDYLKPDIIMASEIELGGGFVNCAHGTFPVPAPATAEILKDIPVKMGKVNVETTTPTGAAIIASTVSRFNNNPRFTIKKIGYGIGARDLDIPNILRVFLAETTVKEGLPEKNMLIECNIDDMNPENYEHVIEKLFDQKADDVFITPIIMKKNRPAVKLSILCKEKYFHQIKDIIFKETTTFGFRYYDVEKNALERSFKKIMIEDMPVNVKLAYYNGNVLKYKPEYNDCNRLAKKMNISIRQVYQIIESKMNTILNT